MVTHKGTHKVRWQRWTLDRWVPHRQNFLMPAVTLHHHHKGIACNKYAINTSWFKVGNLTSCQGVWVYNDTPDDKSEHWKKNLWESWTKKVNTVSQFWSCGLQLKLFLLSIIQQNTFSINRLTLWSIKMPGNRKCPPNSDLVSDLTVSQS